jgi:hypothetical protein
MTTDQSPDIGAVLESLRREVRARRLAAPGPEQSALARQLARSAEQLEITRVVSAHWPLEGGSIPQRAMNLVNKVVRRGLRWYINPIVEQQNAFNEVTTRALRQLVDAYEELRIATEELAAAPADSSPSPPTGEGVGGEGLDLPDLRLLQEIVERNAATAPHALLADLGLPTLALTLRDRRTVLAHWPLASGSPVGATQKLVRRYLRWLINPIVEQQNAFNDALATALPLLLALDAETRALLAARRRNRR